MLQFIQNLKWREVLPRMAADFLIMHVSMIAAMATSVVYRTATHNTAAAASLVAGFLQYYMVFFWVLSPIFIVVFFLNGFYTHSRAYVGRYKSWVVLRGVAMAVMVFVAANFLIFGWTKVGRSVVVPFLVLAVAGTVAARLLKGFLELRYDVKPKNSPLLASPRDLILVVGGAGYIGSILVDELLQKGHRVRVLDNLLYGEEPLRRVKNHPNFELIVGDCRNIQDMVRAVRGAESIVHLAAIVGDPACDQDRGPALETNYAATRMLIEIAKGHGVGKFIFASSCSVYGATDIKVDESSPAQPISLYGQTKVDSEQALLNARSSSFHPTILRYATVFGLGYRPRFDLVVNLLTAKAHQEGMITIYNGEQWRPFIHVRDLVDATIRVLEAPSRITSGEIFNVGDKSLNHTLAGVADIIREAYPNVRIERVSNSDLRNYRVNFDKLLNRMGFRARHTVRDGVEELKNAFDEGLIGDYKNLRYHNQRFLQAVGTLGYKDEADARVMAAFLDPARLVR